MSTMVVDGSDFELVQGMLAGSRAAWRLFSQRYDGLIYAAIDRVLRHFPKLDVRSEREDVRAALLCSLVAREKHKLRAFQFERGVRLSTWIHLLSIHAARDHVRSARNRAALLPVGRLAEAADENVSGPLAALLTKESLARASNVLAQFSLKDRQFVSLLFVEGQAPDRIAELMNISVKTVYTKKHKLVHRLQHALRN